jgi:hypothetical protein
MGGRTHALRLRRLLGGDERVVVGLALPALSGEPALFRIRICVQYGRSDRGRRDSHCRADGQRGRGHSPEADGPLGASLDWRRSEGEEWTITFETADGTSVRLEDGGARLIVDGETSADSGVGEYPGIYRTFVDLIDERRSLVDVAPLRLVADCLLVGSRSSVEPIYC